MSMDTESTNAGNDNSQTNADAGNADQQQSAAPNLGQIRKSGQREVLDVLSKVTGQQFGNTRDAASFVEQLFKAQSTSGDAANNQTQARSKEAPSKANGEMAELRSMIQTLQSSLAEKDQVVRKTSLQSQIKEVAVKNGFDPQYLDLATGLFESQLAFDEDGSYYVKGKDGGVKLDQNGDPYSLDKLAQEILKSRSKLALDEPRTGTGTKFGFSSRADNQPGGEIPDAATNPEGWAAWKKANGVGRKGTMGIGVQMTRRSL